ncbi:MAG: hypothetical protein GC149_14885 [Gammaproteobacteria bacterium]|nr:hypothetical protein [Gammaproteobacteria bacterium]
MNRMKLLAVLTLMLAGCANTTPVKTEPPVLKFDYHTQANAPENGKIIAITSYQFLTNNAPRTKQPDAGLLNFKLASDVVQFSAVTNYHENYELQLQTAMQSALAEMISKRGFTVTGPFKSSEEIPYTDKKHLYLIILPRLNLDIEQRPTTKSCIHSICTDKGVITLGGSLLLRFIEPLSEQTLLTKRIDLTEPGISKNYIHQYPQVTRKAVMQGLMYSDNELNSLIDDADKQLVDALNEFYRAAMTKTDALISAKELLSHQDDLDQIRGFKRR